LAHQELSQLDNSQVLNSILSNPAIRICFKLGDTDSKKMADGFTHFESQDLQSLSIGQAIMRVGSSNDDFNVMTSTLEEVTIDHSESIISSVREKYATPKLEVEELLVSLLPNIGEINNTIKVKNQQNSHTEEKSLTQEVSPVVNEIKQITTISNLEQQKESYLQDVKQKEQEGIHRSIQNYILTLGQQRGFLSELEKETKNGGRIDVTLQKDDVRIAVEISVSNTIDYEVQNIQKCLKENYTKVYMVSESKVHLSNIRKRTKETIENKDFRKVSFGSPAHFLTYLNTFEEKPKEQIKRVRGYRVKIHQSEDSDVDKQSRNSKIQNIILKAVKKKPKKG